MSQESYYNNLRQSLRQMPVNEVSREEEAHTRRKNNTNNRRVYLTPKPIQLPSTQQQDQRSSHQHNLLDMITGSKKIINRFTKRSPPTNKDSVDREKIQDISGSSSGEIVSSSSSSYSSSHSLQSTTANSEEEVQYRQRRERSTRRMGHTTSLPQHCDIINAQVSIPRDTCDTDAAQCRISSLTRNDSHQREEEDGIIQNQLQQQPVRLSTMQQHIEQSQLQNHHQHEESNDDDDDEDDESWKIDALLLQQRDITQAIEQSLQEQSSRTSPHPTTHHNQSQSPSDRSHTTRRRTQTPPSYERFMDDSIERNERSSLMDDIINNTKEGQYDVNVLKEMGLIRSSSTSSSTTTYKEEVVDNKEEVVDRHSSTHSWLKDVLDAEGIIDPEVLKELGVEDLDLDQQEEPLKSDSTAKLKRTFLSGYNVLAADTSDDMVRGRKKIDTDSDEQQQQQHADEKKKGNKNSDITIDDHDPLPPSNDILSTILGKSHNTLVSSDSSRPTVITTMVEEDDVRGPILNDDDNIINEALSCSGVSGNSPIVSTKKGFSTLLDISSDIISTNKKKEGKLLPKLPTMKGKSTPSSDIKSSSSQQLIKSSPQSELASYTIAANLFGIKEFTCMKNRYLDKADALSPLSSLSVKKDDRILQVPREEDDPQLLPQSSDEIRHDSSFSFADDDDKAPRTKPSLGFVKRRHVHHPSGGVRQDIKSVERARAA